MENKKSKSLKSLVLNIASPYLGLPKEVYILFIAQIANSLGALVFPFLTLILKRKIGFGPADISKVIALSALMFGISSIIGGKISDSIGRKKTIITFELAGIAAYTACLFIGTGMFLVVMIMIASFFFGLSGPSHSAMIADLTEGKQRNGAYSLLYFGLNIGFVFAMMIGGFLFEHSFRLLFLIDAGTVLIAVILIALFVSETHPEKSVKTEEEAETFRTEKKVSVLKILFRKPVLLLFTLAVFGYRLVYAQWSFLIPLHAERNFSDKAGELQGQMGALNASIVVIFTLILTRIFRKLSNIQRIIIAGVFFLFGFGMLGFIDARYAFFLSIFVFTIGEIIEAISLMPFIMNHTPATHRGRVGSLLSIMFGAGIAIGPLLTGPLSEKYSFEFAWHIIAAIALASIILMIAVAALDKKHTEALPEQE